MQRRSFIAGLVATAAGLLVPARLIEDDPKRVYSFVRRPTSPTIRIYEGMQPSAADAAVSEDAMLAELEFSGSHFTDYSASRTGTASWVRYTDAAGRAIDLPINVSGEELHGGFGMNTRCITSGSVVSCSSLVITKLVA